MNTKVLIAQFYHLVLSNVPQAQLRASDSGNNLVKCFKFELPWRAIKLILFIVLVCPSIARFSYDHSQMRPSMFWWSLKRVLKCLLPGSPLLEKLSLVSLPCPLDSVLQYVLLRGDFFLPRFRYYNDLPPMPLRQLQHIELQRTDVRTETVKKIMLHSKRLKYVDLRYCWEISRQDCWGLRFHKAEVVWS